MPDAPSSASLAALTQALRQGKGRAATEAFKSLAQLETSPEEAGRMSGEALQSLWDQFFVEAVTGFAKWLESFPLEEATRPALAPVEQAIEWADQWRRTWLEVAGEREARILREHVRSDHLKEALALARQILSSARSPEALRAQAVRLGVILGSLDNDRPAAEKVMTRLKIELGEKGQAGTMAAEGIDEGCGQSRRNVTLTDMGQREMAWNRIHTDAVVELIRQLPDAATAGHPTDEQQERAWRRFHAACAGWFLASAQGAAAFSDLARLLREFCPTDPRAAGPVEGVEDVAFLRLNGLARLTAVRTMRRLGKCRRLVDATLQAYERTPAGSRAQENIVRLMGGLSSSSFAQPLARRLDDRNCAHMVDDIIDALGRIGDAQSHEMLEERFKAETGARRIDPPRRRRIETILAALGRIARHPDTSTRDRNAIARTCFENLPDDRSLARAALSHFCSFDPAGLAPDVRRLALRNIVDSLWSLDTESKLAPGNPAQRSELGFREELVEIVRNMGQAALDPLLEEAHRRVMQYSGAYWAMAEVLADIGDQSALPLLRMMLTNTLQTDENAIPEHLRETYYDAAMNERVPLSKDKIVHALVFTIHKIGGEEGMQLLQDVAEDIRTGEREAPGPMTMELLAELLVPGKLSKERAAPPPKPSVEAPGTTNSDRNAVALDGVPSDWLEDTEAAPPRAARQDEARPRRDDPEKALLKDIAGKGLFKAKIENRVGAIQEAAARGEIQYVVPLCRLLDDSNVALRGAAETALLRIVRPAAGESIFRIALGEMLDFLHKATDDQAKAIAALINKMRPDRDPTRGIVERFNNSVSDQRVKRITGDILHPPDPRSYQVKRQLAAGDRDGDEEAEATEAAPASHQDLLAMKMEYMAARRKWIQGGKQGDPPEPPPGYPGA